MRQKLVEERKALAAFVSRFDALGVGAAGNIIPAGLRNPSVFGLGNPSSSLAFPPIHKRRRPSYASGLEVVLEQSPAKSGQADLGMSNTPMKAGAEVGVGASPSPMKMQLRNPSLSSLRMLDGEDEDEEGEGGGSEGERERASLFRVMPDESMRIGGIDEDAAEVSFELALEEEDEGEDEAMGFDAILQGVDGVPERGVETKSAAGVDVRVDGEDLVPVKVGQDVDAGFGKKGRNVRRCVFADKENIPV